MNYILDTHTFIWILGPPNVLPETVQQIVSDRAVKIFISLVTPWEMSIKANLGKLDVAHILDNFEEHVEQNGYIILETSVAQVIRAGQLPHYHRDPFDRLLAAQSLEMRAPILSSDRVFDLYGVKRIWD